MKSLLAGSLLALTSVAGAAWAQDGVPPRAEAPAPGAYVSGRVLVRGERIPIVGATVRSGSPESVAETDVTGRFELPLQPGEHLVTVSAPGFASRTYQERVPRGEAVQVVYRLERTGARRFETRVSTQRERTEVARVRLQDAELREVPGTQGEPLRVVGLLPGVAGLASGISYPVVRGSAPATTGYFIDGVRVPQLFHLLVGPSVVHPDLLDAVDFHPGLAPLRYGGLLGGSVQGRVRAPRDGVLHGSVSADLINAGALLETAVGERGPRVTVAGRVSYVPWLGAQVLRELTRPAPGASGTTPVADFWDYQGRVEQAFGSARLRLLVFGSSDLAGGTSEDPEGTSALVGSRFHRADLRLRQPLGVGQLELGVTAGTERMSATARQGILDLVGFDLSRSSVAARAAWSAELAQGVAIRVGLDAERAGSRMDIGGVLLTRAASSPTDVFHTPAHVLVGGVYSEASWAKGALEVTGGVRLDSYHLVPGLHHVAVAPRLGVRWEPRETWTVSAGVGLVHQPPTVLLTLPVSDTAGLRQGLQQGAQAEVGAAWRPSEAFELTAGAYVTRLSRAVEYGLEQLVERRRRLSDSEDPGVPGRAWGVELMLRRPVGGRWFGWLSYSLQRSDRLQRFYRFDPAGRVSGPAEAWVPFAFDQTHVLNATAGLELGKGVRLGASVHLNTGRPESGQLTSRAQRVGEDARTGLPLWVPDDLDSGARLPPFARLDLRASKEWIFEDYRLELYLDVLNATVSREVLGYTYVVDRNVPVREPISLPAVFPMLGVKGSF